MLVADRSVQRAAVIAALVAKAPAGFGRTALMKCLYFLQILCRMPLGYDFRLYTYGPFAQNVLADLDLAERLGAVRSDLEILGAGYRYNLRRGDALDRVTKRATQILAKHHADIDWVADNFAGRSARELENASTIVFIDRAAIRSGEALSIAELVRKVHDVKPYLSDDFIEREALSLKEQKLISANA